MQQNIEKFKYLKLILIRIMKRLESRVKAFEQAVIGKGNQLDCSPISH